MTSCWQHVPIRGTQVQPASMIHDVKIDIIMFILGINKSESIKKKGRCDSIYVMEERVLSDYVVIWKARFSLQAQIPPPCS